MNFKRRIGSFCFLVIFFIFLTIPIFLLLSVSFQYQDTITETASFRYRFIPSMWSWKNFQDFFDANNEFLKTIYPSFKIFFFSTLLASFFSISAIYHHYFKSFPKKTEYSFVLLIISAYFCPIFAILRPITDFNLIKLAPYPTIIFFNTVLGASFIALISIFGFLKKYQYNFQEWLMIYRHRWLAFRHVTLVNTWPLLLCAIFLAFSSMWNDFYMNSLLSFNLQTKPFTVKILTMIGQYKTNYGPLAVAALISILTPLFLILPALFFFHRANSR